MWIPMYTFSRNFSYCKHNQEMNKIMAVGWREMVLSSPDNKVHGAIMGPIWGRQVLGGPPVGPLDFAIWVGFLVMSSNAYLDRQQTQRKICTTNNIYWKSTCERYVPCKRSVMRKIC